VKLSADGFPAFVREVHGRVPFPWQTRLVEQVLAEGCWPDLIDVPTGLGKTSLLDAAIFLAATAPGPDGPGRRRTFFVVDRRLVVDETFRHALQLAGALGRPSGPVCVEVAARLRGLGQLSPDDLPLTVARMRGGISWDWRWLDRPDRAAIVVGTVDQLGSRLFFRGYGVGPHLRSIDAALVGADSLTIVDEAHLSQPFVETLNSAVRLDPTQLPVGTPVVITMSATPGAVAGARTFGIGPDDRADPIAARRLDSAKRLHLVTLAKGGDREVAPAMASLAQRLAVDGSVVGVVVNTVNRARSVFELLRADHPDRVILLTGRIRPVDRDALVDTWLPHIGVDRSRSCEGDPLFVVATQTIEVGANIDLDSLVTDSCALDALVQRIGRLNRIGHNDSGRVVVVHEPLNGPDFIYGPAREATVSWLLSHVHGHACRTPAEVDALPFTGGLHVGPGALHKLLSKGLPPDVLAPVPYTPVLTEVVLDTWARTSPAPVPDTPVAPFLHGIGEEGPQVGIVWRADVDDHEPASWAASAAAVPPSAEEVLEVPLVAARRWLAGLDPAPVSDAPGTAGAPEETAGGRPAIRFRSVDDWAIRRAGGISSGDLLIVPISYGGSDEWGWAPNSSTAVVDVADLADRRGRPILRIDPRTLRPLLADRAPIDPLIERLGAAIRDEDDQGARSIVDGLLDALRTEGVPARLAAAATLLARGRRITIGGELGRPLAIVSRGAGNFADDETADGSSTLATRVALTVHHAAVGARARHYAQAIGLAPELIEAVATAAGWHDHGKQDPRFQAMLNGGRTVAGDLLAKSDSDPADRQGRQRAQRLAGYPRGMRHEAASAVIMRIWLAAQDQRDADADLLIHLVGAHHGRNRPLFPPVVDTDPRSYEAHIDGMKIGLDSSDTLDWDAPGRFQRLNRRYGRWGLALLEAIVRMADICCSEEGT